MKNHLKLLVVLLFASCNSTPGAVLNTIKTDLEGHFEIPVDIIIHGGTKKNYLEINVTDYDLQNRDDIYLDSLAKAIQNRIETEFPKTKKLAFIELILALMTP